MQTTVAEYVALKLPVALLLPTPASSNELHEMLRLLPTVQLGVPLWTCVPVGALAELNVGEYVPGWTLADAPAADRAIINVARPVTIPSRFMSLALPSLQVETRKLKQHGPSLRPTKSGISPQGPHPEERCFRQASELSTVTITSRGLSAVASDCGRARPGNGTRIPRPEPTTANSYEISPLRSTSLGKLDRTRGVCLSPYGDMVFFPRVGVFSNLPVSG